MGGSGGGNGFNGTGGNGSYGSGGAGGGYGNPGCGSTGNGGGGGQNGVAMIRLPSSISVTVTGPVSSAIVGSDRVYTFTAGAGTFRINR